MEVLSATVGKPHSVFATIKQVEQAMLEKLHASALSSQDAHLLQYTPLTSQQVATAHATLPAHRAGFVIPYFSINGKPSKFYRFRYLEYGHDSGFARLVAAQLKQLRYGQTVGTMNELYLPPYIDWAAYSKDASKPVLITEGELKAACSTKHGVPCIGLGGVWCFKAGASGVHLLPQFAEFTWKDRVVYIVYDSDAASNHQVVKAENALARELCNLGAVPAVVRLPALQAGSKTGLDDYIVALGTDKLMEALLLPAEPWLRAAELHQLNEEVIYVEEPGLILKLANLQRMAPRAFTDHAYSTRIYHENQVTATTTKMVEKSAAKEWLKWPARATVHKVTYAPGQPRVTASGELNVWKGWAVQPAAGIVAPWTQLLDYLFVGAKSDDRTWFEQWLAYPLQYPGEKLYSCCVLWGNHHGTGKSAIGYTMFKIYGDNSTEIGDRDLYSTHNEWAENKQFVMGDEITSGGENKRSSADRMKSMITQRLLRLNPKYISSYTVPDCLNYYFTSNHPDSFFIDDNDRRYFVHEVKGQPQPRSFYISYFDWLAQNGAAALFYYLLNLDMTGFDPAGKAPSTSSKLDMIDSGRSDCASWVAMLKEEPDRVLQVGGKPLHYQLWTTTELHGIYDPQRETRVTANGLARELRRAGLCKVFDGQGVPTTLGGRQRLWAIRNADKLLPLDSGKLGKIYDQEREAGGARKRQTKF
jgi:hypothetical protein